MKKIIYMITILITISLYSICSAMIMHKDSTVKEGCISGNCSNGYGVYVLKGYKYEGNFLKNGGLVFDGFGITTEYVSNKNDKIYSITREYDKNFNPNTGMFKKRTYTVISFDENGEIENIHYGKEGPTLISVYNEQKKVHYCGENGSTLQEKQVVSITTEGKYYSEKVTVLCTDGTKLIFNLDGSLTTN
jgi:hypothetical protein